MNQNQETLVCNPWADRSRLPAVSGRNQIIAAIVCFLCALGMPFCVTYEPVAFALIGVAIAYLLIVVHTPSMTAMVLLTAVATTLLGGGIFGGAIFLALVVGTTALSFLFTAARTTAYAVLLPIAAAVLTYVITKDMRFSMLALSFLPAGILLSLATLRGKSRTTAICFGIGGFLAVILAWTAFGVYRTTGTLNAAGIRSFVEIARNTVLDVMMAARDSLLEISSSALEGEQAQQAYAQFAEMMSDDALRQSVAQIFNVLPAVVALVCSILAYEAQSLLNATYHSTGLDVVLTNTAKFFTMSLTSAILYSISFILFLFVPSTNMVGAVAANLSLILLPGYFLIGAQGIVLTIAQTKGKGRAPLILILVFLLCCCSGSSLLYVLAMWGAYGRIMYAVRSKILEKTGNSQNNGGDDPL